MGKKGKGKESHNSTNHNSKQTSRKQNTTVYKSYVMQYIYIQLCITFVYYIIQTIRKNQYPDEVMVGASDNICIHNWYCVNTNSWYWNEIYCRVQRDSLLLHDFSIYHFYCSVIWLRINLGHPLSIFNTATVLEIDDISPFIWLYFAEWGYVYSHSRLCEGTHPGTTPYWIIKKLLTVNYNANAKTRFFVLKM